MSSLSDHIVPLHTVSHGNLADRMECQNFKSLVATLVEKQDPFAQVKELGSEVHPCRTGYLSGNRRWLGRMGWPRLVGLVWGSHSSLLTQTPPGCSINVGTAD